MSRSSGVSHTDRTAGAAQPVLRFALSEPAALNAVQIAIQRNAGNFFQPGMLLSPSAAGCT